MQVGTLVREGGETKMNRGDAADSAESRTGAEFKCMHATRTAHIGETKCAL